MELKEREVSGEWLTVERMQKSGEYSKYFGWHSGGASYTLHRVI